MRRPVALPVAVCCARETPHGLLVGIVLAPDDELPRTLAPPQWESVAVGLIEGHLCGRYPS